MVESDDEEILFSSSNALAHHQGKGLLGNGVKTIDDIMNGPKPDRRLKKTIALCTAFLGLGLAIAVLGPTLKDLQHKVKAEEIHKMSYVFVGRSIGYLCGSVMGGIMLEWFNPLLLLACTLLTAGVGLVVSPFCSNLPSLASMTATVGVATGALDTGANVLCLRLWGKRSPPFMQALHFSFAVGAFISPLLAAPFIEQVATVASMTPTAATMNMSNVSVAMVEYTTSTAEITRNGSEDNDQQKRINRVVTSNQISDEAINTTQSSEFQYVYIIIGIIIMLVSLSFFYFFFTSPAKQQATSTLNEGSDSKDDFKNTIMFLMFIFYFLYVGAEIAFGGYIFSFARELNFDPAKASLLNSAFWGAFAFGRGLSICLASVMTPLTMLTVDMTGCILSSLALSMYGEDIMVVLWVGTIGLGFSMASLFPSGISWLESYTKVTGNMASILIIGSALGEMTFPMLIGSMFDDESNSGPGAMILMYVTLAASGLTAIIFIVVYYLANLNGAVQKQSSKALSSPHDMLDGIQDAFQMEGLGPTKVIPKQVSKKLIPKPLQSKNHRD